MLKFFIRIVAALIIGLFLSLWIIQHTPSVKKLISSKIIEYVEQDWKTHISLSGVKINFFTSSIYLKHGKIVPIHNKDFMWQFDECKVYICPFDLIFKNKISLSLTFNNFKADTSYQNSSSDLITHFADIFATKSPKLSVVTKSLTMHNLELMVKLPQHNAGIIRLLIPGTFSIVKTEIDQQEAAHRWEGFADVNDAMIIYKNDIIAQKLCGKITFYQNSINNTWSFTKEMQGQIPFCGQSTQCIFQGEWNQDQKKVVIKDAFDELDLTCHLTSDSQCKLQGKVPISYLTNIAHTISTGALQPSLFLPSISGNCSVDLTLDRLGNYFTTIGSASLTDLKIASYKIQQIDLNFMPHGEQAYSTVDIIQSSGADVQGTLLWDWLEADGSLALTNTRDLAVSSPATSMNTSMAYVPLSIQKGDLAVNIALDKQGVLKGTYHCLVRNFAIKKEYPYKGAIIIKNGQVGLKGTSNNGNYTIKAKLAPHLHLTRWRYSIGERDFINIAQSKGKPFVLEGYVRWAFIRSFFDQNLRHIIFNNNGMFAVSMDQQNSHNVRGKLRLVEGKFFVPNYHNLIQKVNADFDLSIADRRLIFDNVAIGLSKGNVKCPRATLTFNEDYTIDTIHAPCMVENLFVNWKRDFYGFVYGNLLLNKVHQHIPKLTGSLILKKSLLKNTFFGEKTTSYTYGPMESPSLSRFPIDLGIKIMTEKPISIKTPTLHTTASLDLMIKNAHIPDLCTMPHIGGVITFSKGYLKFFNNKLYIDYGKVQFVANNMNDPVIDFVAKNRIGKYMISLHVTGTAQKPTIVFESMPYLTEQQIVSLLLAGSEDATLQAGLPIMLLQNLDTFILGNTAHLKTAPWVNKLSKTLKYVQITPSLTDDANPTKLKGSISVNVNDQLRAQVQKSFDLQNDFSAQLEYMLSDDINVKVVRNQQGELGSEVEMRFKLG